MKLNDIQKLVLKAVLLVRKKETLEEAGEQIVEDVKTRTRIGKGVNQPEGAQTNLKPLELKTKLIRRDLKRKGKLTGPNAQPAKSGVNRTGKTLESMHAEAKDGKLEIKLDSEGEQVAVHLQNIDKQRFTFMNLSKAETKRLIEFLEEKVRQLDRKFR